MYLLVQLGWREFLDALAQIPWTTFAVAFGMVVVSRIAGVSRWYYLLRSAQVDVPWRRAFVLTFSGLFASNFLPTTVGGDVIRIAGVAQVESRRTAYVTSVFADRIVGMLGMAMALPFGVGPLIAYLQGAGGVALLPLPASRLGGSWISRIKARLRQIALAVRESFELVATESHQCPVGLRQHGGHHAGAFRQHLGARCTRSTNPSACGPLRVCGASPTLSPWSRFRSTVLGLQEVSMTFIYMALGGVSTASILPTAILVRVMDALVSVPGALMLPQSLAWSRRRPDWDG